MNALKILREESTKLIKRVYTRLEIVVHDHT